MAGYSGTPLPQKLGIKARHQVALVNAASSFAAMLGPLPEEVELRNDLRGDPFDVVVFFTRSRADLTQRFTRIAKHLKPAGGLWVCWPKKASGVPTDLTEPVVRAMGLEAGLVDNKVCAVDDTWSGLRFVIRVQDRPKGKSRGRR